MKRIKRKECLLQEIDIEIERLNAEINTIDIDSTSVIVTVIVSIILLFAPIVTSGIISGNKVIVSNVTIPTVTLKAFNIYIGVQNWSYRDIILQKSTLQYWSVNEKGMNIVILLFGYWLWYVVMYIMYLCIITYVGKNFSLAKVDSPISITPLIKAGQSVMKTISLVISLVTISYGIAVILLFPDFLAKESWQKGL